MCAETREFGWVPVQGEPRSMDDSMTQRPKPSNPLPDGWSWSWEMFTHESPDQHCHCGVYIADEPKTCVSYMGHSNGIICEIALWGRVIPASYGARGQFAYPQRILAPRSLVGSVKLTAKLYNIPILVLDPLDSKEICLEPGCECVETCRVTGYPRTPFVPTSTWKLLEEQE
jgi:hypothetical protein